MDGVMASRPIPVPNGSLAALLSWLRQALGGASTWAGSGNEVLCAAMGAAGYRVVGVLWALRLTGAALGRAAERPGDWV
jgi:hypothetical protein